VTTNNHTRLASRALQNQPHKQYHLVEATKAVKPVLGCVFGLLFLVSGTRFCFLLFWARAPPEPTPLPHPEAKNTPHTTLATQNKHNSPYYREPVPCPPHGVPVQLYAPLKRSFGEDHFVADSGDIVFYEKDPKF
jgi:hypothetical protein